MQRCEAIRAHRNGTKQGLRVQVSEVETVRRGAIGVAPGEGISSSTATLGGSVKLGFAGITTNECGCRPNCWMPSSSRSITSTCPRLHRQACPSSAPSASTTGFDTWVARIQERYCTYAYVGTEAGEAAFGRLSELRQARTDKAASEVRGTERISHCSPCQHPSTVKILLSRRSTNMPEEPKDLKIEDEETNQMLERGR